MAAGDITQGTRLHDVKFGDLPDDAEYPYVGGYWKDSHGTWWCGVPAQGAGIGNLSRHAVVEHDDGTITVSPSILVTGGPVGWHGYLDVLPATDHPYPGADCGDGKLNVVPSRVSAAISANESLSPPDA